MSICLWPAGGMAPWRRGFPLFLAEPRSSVERLRAAASKEAWTRGPIWKRCLLGGAMAIGWPSVTFADAVRISARRAREDRAPFLSSVSTLYRAAMTRNIPPGVGAVCERSFDRDATDLADFLLPLDLLALRRISLRRGAVLEQVQNKAAFEQICRDHGLPCVETIAAFDRGMSVGEDRLRACNAPVFVKALTGNKGAGAELWRRGGRGFVSTGGEDLTADELIDRLRPENCIVQPALQDHPALKEFGTAALSSLRIVTARGRSIPATVIAASLSLAVEPDSLTGHNGVQCGIDIDSGAITDTTRPIDEDARLIRRDLIGLVLPHWAECVALVRRAHDEAFPAFVTLGWDLVLSSAGPLLLETNANWGMIGHQMLAGPLGATALGPIIEELLEPVAADRSPAGSPPARVSRSPLPAPRADRGPSGAGSRRPRRRATKAS